MNSLLTSHIFIIFKTSCKYFFHETSRNFLVHQILILRSLPSMLMKNIKIAHKRKCKNKFAFKCKKLYLCRVCVNETSFRIVRRMTTRNGVSECCRYSENCIFIYRNNIKIYLFSRSSKGYLRWNAICRYIESGDISVIDSLYADFRSPEEYGLIYSRQIIRPVDFTGSGDWARTKQKWYVYILYFCALACGVFQR